MRRAMNLGIMLVLLASWATIGHSSEITVTDDQSLRAALAQLAPGLRVNIEPGDYRGGIYLKGLRGTARQPIVIAGSDPQRPPRFRGGSDSWHLVDCEYLVVKNLRIESCRDHGFHADDGGSYDSPSRHLVLENITFHRIGQQDWSDAVKFSGVDEFAIRNCQMSGWGAHAVNLIGCHRGQVTSCVFRALDGFRQANGVQTKGGSRDVTIRGCYFLNVADRALNLGGTTGERFFRPAGAEAEAQDVTVERCVIVGSQSPVAFVGAQRVVFRYNTVYRPRSWILRILQENRRQGLVSCREGRVERNVFVFRELDLKEVVNIGPATQPHSFAFVDNAWYCQDRPAASRVRLPAVERGGVYGRDPQFANARRYDLRPRSDSRLRGYGAFAAQAAGELPNR